LARRDAGPRLEEDGMFRDRLRIGPNDRVVLPGLSAQPLDRCERVRDRVVLVAVADVGPGEDVPGEDSRSWCLGVHVDGEQERRDRRQALDVLCHGSLFTELKHSGPCIERTLAPASAVRIPFVTSGYGYR